jgi:hypothetical protein
MSTEDASTAALVCGVWYSAGAKTPVTQSAETKFGVFTVTSR